MTVPGGLADTAVWRNVHFALPAFDLERTSLASSDIAIRAAMIAFGRGEHEAPRGYLYSRRYRGGILAPPHHHRRAGRIAAAADRGQQCRLAVGCLQKLVEARQMGKARHLAKASRLGEACSLAKALRCKACRSRAGRLDPFRFETGLDKLRSLENPDRSGCGAYRRIRRRDQRPQCR